MVSAEDFEDDRNPDDMVEARLARMKAIERKQLRELVAEIAARKVEALSLYEPLPFQERYHACTAKECILQKGNQAGGSMAGFAEVARAITQRDPYNKYPKTGTAVCLGYGEGHIGRVIHKYLFRWGAFQIIKDLETGEWRTFRPWGASETFNGKPGDAGREMEARPAPPMIPKRFIDGRFSWVKRSEHIFSYVKFTTGWELYAFNSQGSADMGQGFQVDLYHIDEDVATEGWYTEAIGRTAIRRGRIRWTALPHAKTDDIVQMIGRGEAEEGAENPSTVCVKATMYDNPYFPEESRKHNEKVLREKGEDVYRQRVLGELTVDTLRMYPYFDTAIHTALVELDEEEQQMEAAGRPMRAKVQRVLTELKGIPPMDWCRYMVVDPGFSVCSVHFYAVPPPADFGTFKVLYDELYLTSCTAKIFATRAHEKAKGFVFQDFIIDAHGGRVREIGSGILPQRQYELELERVGLACEARGSRFTAGSDNVEGREIATRRWMEIRSEGEFEAGYPTLLIVVDKCPNTCREISRFRKLTVRQGGRDIVTDKGNRRAATHAVECTEYAAAHGLAYIRPPMRIKPLSDVTDEIREGRRLRELKRRMREGRASGRHIDLGPRGDSQ